MLSAPACGACHTPARSRNDIGGGENRAQAGDARERAGRRTPLTGPGITARRLLQFYAGDALPVALWKEFTVPWNPDERVERLKTMTVRELQSLNGSEQFGRSFGNGVFARANGSPYYTTRVPDLRGLRDSRYPRRNRDTPATWARRHCPIRRARDGRRPDGGRPPANPGGFAAPRTVPLCRRSAVRNRRLPDVARAPEQRRWRSSHRSRTW